MGWAQRSRKKLAPGTRCYLCGEIIEPTEKWNRDHVPPKRIFASQILKQFNPNLQRLPTHEACNSAYRADEEYFVVSFAGHVNTPTANAVFKDLRDAVRNGHGVGLLKEVLSRFGKVMGPNGEVLYSYATDRVQRFLWKLVRGLYYVEVGIVLPEKTLGDIYLIEPSGVANALARIGWFPVVRDTTPMAQYGAVFDYKWIGWKDGNLRGHAFAMLFWDGLIVATLFHDPICECETCVKRRADHGAG